MATGWRSARAWRRCRSSRWPGASKPRCNSLTPVPSPWRERGTKAHQSGTRMLLADFQLMVERMLGEVPEKFLEGIVGLEVSSRAVPHPEREGVYTLGECVPLEAWADSASSRIVL